jgi:hypothetical protein
VIGLGKRGMLPDVRPLVMKEAASLERPIESIMDDTFRKVEEHLLKVSVARHRACI